MFPAPEELMRLPGLCAPTRTQTYAQKVILLFFVRNGIGLE